MSISVDTAIRNAEALLKMEGMQPSPEVLSNCKKVLNGEISKDQYISMIKERYMEAPRVEV